jgi:hypothetical protein
VSDILKQQLQWYPALGIGHFPVSHQKTDYFEQYQGYEGHGITAQLNQERTDLVNQFVKGNVLDFGIGAGTFIETRGREITRGYDIDPKGIKWLKDNGLYSNPYDKKTKGVQCVTFWDSLEHLRLPQMVLNRVTEYVFISIPIFEDVEHIQTSKHYKENEHYWYFTFSGLVIYMNYCGFDMEHETDIEVKLGREDVHTFVFRRRKD